MQQQPETEYHPQLDRFITEAEEAEYNRRHADLINEMRESIDCRMANTIMSDKNITDCRMANTIMSDKNITVAQIDAAILAVRKIGYGPEETKLIVETALTAAAQVGEPYICALQTGKSGRRCIGWDNAIERCAHVVEGISNRDTCLEAAKPHFAAAIRKLKDAP